ncbi:MAG TPA: tetratricopeptide repeat protein [Acidobacteriaceae bacterium]|nr:tetratricopeptide repeat protein [Acidobacteriaceae bacterium]
MNRVPLLRVLVAAVVAAACLRGSAQTTVSYAQQRDAAITLQQQGELAQAEVAWQTILKSHPADADACANLGVISSQQKHYGDAVRYYRKALAIKPSMPGLQMNLGLALFKSGDMKGSARVFVSLYHRTSPDSPDGQRLRLLIGMADYGAGDYAAAIPYLRDATTRDPQNLPYRLVLAHSCLWARKYKCVLDVYHEILALNAESAEADMLAGEAYDEMRDHESAIQQFRNAVKADPKIPGVHFGLGYLLWAQSQYEEAAEQFGLEVENQPNDAESIAYWADSNVRLNRADVARPLVEKALKLNSRQELPWLDLGILDAQAGNNDAAFRDFQTAAKIAPDDVQVHWRLARLYQSMGKRVEAQAEFAKTKRLTQAADQSLRQKLQASHAQDSQSEAPSGSAAASSPSQP